jgi:hypothetical protein
MKLLYYGVLVAAAIVAYMTAKWVYRQATNFDRRRFVRNLVRDAIVEGD